MVAFTGQETAADARRGLQRSRRHRAGRASGPVLVEPTDAIVRVVFSCVCGSDLTYYRGERDHAIGSIGHESIGVVEEVARTFGATDVITERGEEAIAAIMEMTGGVGVDASLDRVGTADAVATAFGVARPGSMVGFVGISDEPEVPVMPAFWRNVGWRGGPAQVPAYVPDLLPDVLDGRINPGLVFDWEAPLDGLEDAYAAMDERTAIKSLLRVSTP